MERLKKYSFFVNEDMINQKPTEIKKFGEYRKGSNKFGGLVDKMMSWLRLHKTDPKITKLRSDLNIFLQESNISYEELISFLNDENKSNLISFDIEVFNDKIEFSKLNDSKKQRYIWEDLTNH